MATVRGALSKLPGIKKIDITEGNKPFNVEYDTSKVNPGQMLVALKAAGEGAKLTN